MELRNRVRKPIDNVLLPKFEHITIEHAFTQYDFLGSKISKLLHLVRSLRIENHISIGKQLKKLGESFSNASWELSKVDLNIITDFMNTMRVNPEAWKHGLFDSFKRLLVIVCVMFDEVKRWQNVLILYPSCEEIVEKVWYAVVVSTVALLSSVYQYLLGYDLKGDSKAYSSGSLDFRDTFVSLLLFQGSYVWIFFRDVAPRKVYRRSKKDEAGRVSYYGKFEPRFKPHREKLPGGTTIMFDHLPLGGYGSHRDAEIVCQIAGYYYKRDETDIKLRNDSYFTIPPMPEQEQSLCGMDKVRCVVARAKEVFREFQVINDAIILPSESNTVGVHDFSQHIVREEFNVAALWDDAVDVHPVDWEFANSFGADGEGLEGTVTSPFSGDLNFVDTLIAVGEGSEGTPASPTDAEQVVLRMERPQSPHLETSDVGSLAKLEIITQQLKEQLEAVISRRNSEHEQHLQREKQLEERVSHLERNSKLQLEDEFVRSLLC